MMIEINMLTKMLGIFTADLSQFDHKWNNIKTVIKHVGD